MRFLSLDDNEAGVIAIGAQPVGILAIGGIPVGVVAIGVGAIGVISLSVGAGAGIVSVSCGASVGLFATGVGTALGLKAKCAGWEGSVIPSERYPARPLQAASEFEEVAPGAIHISDLGASGSVPQWVFFLPHRAPSGGDWVLAHEGGTVDLGQEAQAALAHYREGDGPVLAWIVLELTAGQDAADYRSPPAPRRTLRCDRILIAPRSRPDVDRDLASRRRWWIGKLLIKSTLLVMALIGGLGLVSNRLADLGMTRRAETAWHGRLRRAEGMVFPNDAGCSVHGRMRSDGKNRVDTEIEIVCGSLVIYPPTETHACHVIEAPSESKSGHVYRLACRIEGAESSDESRGRPSLEIDTGARSARIVQPLPTPFRVEIDVDPTSEARTGEPLFIGN